MKEITHTFKIGDWIDCSELSDDQVRAIVSRAFSCDIKISGDENDMNNFRKNFVINHCNSTAFSTGVYVRNMERFHGIKPNELTWDDITKPIKPETPWTPKLNATCFVSHLEEDNWVKGCMTGALGDRIVFESEDEVVVLNDRVIKFKPLNREEVTPVDEVTVSPYKPKIGEECEFMCTSREKSTDWVEGGVKYLSKYTCVMKIQSGEFIAHPDTMKFRPIKTEREKLVDLALEQLTAHFIAAMSDRDESTVDAMVELGWRPTEVLNKDGVEL